MNRTNSLTILTMATIGTFLMLANSMMTVNIFASDEESYNKYPQNGKEIYYEPFMDEYDPSELPEYIPRESYGNGDYDHYESGYYEEQGYGIPYEIE